MAASVHMLAETEIYVILWVPLPISLPSRAEVAIGATTAKSC